MRDDPESPGPIDVAGTWGMVVYSLSRPYQVTFPMVALIVLVPFYIFIGEFMPGRTLHVPELPLDRLVSVRPAWALIYGSLYLFLILLPVFVVRQEELIRRTVLAYLLVWTALADAVCSTAMTQSGPRSSSPTLPMDSVEIAEAVRSACARAAAAAYEDAGLRGLCEEGRWEAAIDALRTLDLLKLIQNPQRSDTGQA